VWHARQRGASGSIPPVPAPQLVEEGAEVRVLAASLTDIFEANARPGPLWSCSSSSAAPAATLVSEWEHRRNAEKAGTKWLFTVERRR
jgi:hypothetical protein